MNLKQYHECIDICIEILEKEPNHVKANYRMAQSLYALGEPESNLAQLTKAQTYVTKAKNLAPSDAAINTLFGQIETAVKAATPTGVDGDIDDLD
jgi:tetratricopeptide (TPR) repeat protein